MDSTAVALAFDSPTSMPNEVETFTPTEVAPPDLPSPSYFTEALLTVLGRLVGYQAGQTVKATWDDVYLPVLREAGINENHPQVLSGNWKLRDKRNKPSLYRKINLCYRYRREGKNPLCATVARGEWGLTLEGCKQAVGMQREKLGNPSWLPPGNPTLTFFIRGGQALTNQVRALAAFFGHGGELDFDHFMFTDGLGDALFTGKGKKRSLTPMDVVQVMLPELEVQEIPSNSFFREAVVDLLGEKTDYKPHIGVLSEKDFKNEVLRRVGIDPDSDERILVGAWPLQGKPSLHRQINLALTKQREGKHYCGNDAPRTIMVDRGVFALTEHGVQDALSRLPAPVEEVEEVAETDPASDSMVVSKWLDEQIKKGLLEYMEKSMSAKLAKSYNLGEIQDLVHNYMVDILKSKAFATRIRDGFPPNRSLLVSWALRRAYSKFRNAGKDAHERSLREANTSKERTRTTDGEFDAEKIHSAVVDISVFSEHTPIHLVDGPEGRSLLPGNYSGMPLMDVSDPRDTEALILSAVDKERGLARLERAVKKHKPGAADRYWDIYKKVCEGDSCKEIAESENVSRNRAASLTASLRDSLVDIREDSERAAEILSYIMEEPCSTLHDLQEEFDFGMKTLSKICEWMSHSGWLRQQSYTPKKSVRSVPTFTITSRGETLLRERAMSPEWDINTHVII